MTLDENDDLYTELWHECAGPLVNILRAGQKVVYFPQGHIEQVLLYPPSTFRWSSNLCDLGLDDVKSNGGFWMLFFFPINRQWGFNGRQGKGIFPKDEAVP